MPIAQQPTGRMPFNVSERSGLPAKAFQHHTQARMAHIDTLTNSKSTTCDRQLTELTKDVDATGAMGLFVRDMRGALASYYLHQFLPRWALEGVDGHGKHSHR
jgi:hypothetical protein